MVGALVGAVVVVALVVGALVNVALRVGKLVGALVVGAVVVPLVIVALGLGKQVGALVVGSVVLVALVVGALLVGTVVVGAWGRRTGDGRTVCGRIGGGVTNFSTAAYPAFNMHLNVTLSHCNLVWPVPHDHQVHCHCIT